jgi:hypothetical protein
VLLKIRALAGLAALALVGGAATLAMPSANAETDRCGNGCATLASQKYGAAHVLELGANSTAVLAAPGYNTREDFYGWPEGTVRDLYKVGAIPQAVENTYSSETVYQYEYAPAGGSTAKCLGVTPNAVSGTVVTLLPCGANADTLWVGLSGWQNGNFMPLLSAAASTKSAMLLTATTAAGPLTISGMDLNTTVTNGVTTATVSPLQNWEAVAGVYQSTTTGSISTLIRGDS